VTSTWAPLAWKRHTTGEETPSREYQIQADLFYDYRTNVAAYPAWQAWMRQRQPPMLVLWGKYDPSFVVAGAAAYQRDVPGAEVHVLDAGHFALDEKADEIAVLIRAFLDKHP
jgi:pimeloyl-ACP methyl ester carboxylesterase